MRMSYVGELGYELHIKSSGKGITSIFGTLYSAKNVSLAGFEALKSMSLEKGHRQEQTNYRTGIYNKLKFPRGSKLSRKWPASTSPRIDLFLATDIGMEILRPPITLLKQV